MHRENDKQLLERVKRRLGYPSRDDVVRLYRMRRDGGGGSAPAPWAGSDADHPKTR